MSAPGPSVIATAMSEKNTKRVVQLTRFLVIVEAVVVRFIFIVVLRIGIAVVLAVLTVRVIVVVMLVDITGLVIGTAIALNSMSIAIPLRRHVTGDSRVGQRGNRSIFSDCRWTKRQLLRGDRAFAFMNPNTHLLGEDDADYHADPPR